MSAFEIESGVMGSGMTETFPFFVASHSPSSGLTPVKMCGSPIAPTLRETPANFATG